MGVSCVDAACVRVIQLSNCRPEIAAFCNNAANLQSCKWSAALLRCMLYAVFGAAGAAAAVRLLVSIYQA